VFDRLWSELRYRWRALVRRDTVELELDDELQFHLEQEARKLEAKGLSREAAWRAARVAFGATEAVKDDTRDVRGVVGLEQTWSDFSHTLRSLLAHRAFTVGVVATLALGIGVNATVFGIVDRLLVRSPERLRDVDRVHRVHLSWTQDGQRRSERHVQFPRLTDFQRDLRHFDLVAGFQVRTAAIGRGEDTREAPIAIITPNVLDAFDAPPTLGRWFTAADEAAPDGGRVAVLAHGFWLTRYGGRPEVLGETLQVDRMDATIVGVAPPGFTGIIESRAPAVFVPLRAFASAARGPAFATSYNWSWLELMVRRRAGVTEEAANADLTQAFRRSWAAESALRGDRDDVAERDPSARVGSVHLGRGPDARLDARVALWIAGVAVVVFLVACANVANLFLARAVHRQRDMAMRLALGVGRGRLARQLLMESLTLGVAGGMCGVLLAWTAGSALRVMLLPEGASAAVVTDVRTWLVTFALSLAAGALTVVVPATLAGRLDVTAVLKSGGRGATRPRRRLQAGLVVAQAALSAVLLVGAAVFVLSAERAQAHRLGLDVERLVYAEVNMRGTRLDEAGAATLAATIEDAVRAEPGVAAVTMAASVPFWTNEARGLIVPGVPDIRERGRFTLQAGSPDYFAATGTRILRGRGFTPGDVAGGLPIIVVSDGMARAVWPGREALGQCVRVDTMPPVPGATRLEPPCRTVVGVAEESAMTRLEPTREFTYYLPVPQFPEGVSPQFLVRTDLDTTAIAGALRERIQPLLPGAAYVNVVPLADLVAPQYRAWQAGATVFTAFGALALVLAALGLHSLVAYEVAQREQEFGVRVALGATRRDVLTLVVSRGTRLVAIGVGAGLALAVAVARPLESVLFHQSARDPLVFATVATSLFLAAIVAALAPGLRATRVDPAEALRAE
jgi:putative ABC transport system permease protein